MILELDFFLGLFAGWTLGVAAAYVVVKHELPDDFDMRQPEAAGGFQPPYKNDSGGRNVPLL